LAECSSVKGEDKFGATASYGLTPNVIATFKQINQEASQILYKDNTFFMAFVPQINDTWPAPGPQLMFPLTRFDDRARLSALSKVRRWKIMLIGKVRKHKDGMSIMTRFCTAISDSQLKSLELLLIPSRDESYRKLNSYGGSGRRGHLIRPLQTLRNIEEFRYRTATASEIPSYFYSIDDVADLSGPSRHVGFGQEMRKKAGFDKELQELQDSMQGYRPADSLAKIYNSLVR
jgi:hypothetical protein